MRLRLGTFLLGGIAGAAAVMYLSRRNKSMLFSAFSSSGETMGKAMGKAKNTLANKTFKKSAANMGANMAAMGGGAADGLHQVGKIVNEDSSLKATVNQILEQNKENTAAVQ